MICKNALFVLNLKLKSTVIVNDIHVKHNHYFPFFLHCTDLKTFFMFMFEVTTTIKKMNSSTKFTL